MASSILCTLCFVIFVIAPSSSQFIDKPDVNVGDTVTLTCSYLVAPYQETFNSIITLVITIDRKRHTEDTYTALAAKSVGDVVLNPSIDNNPRYKVNFIEAATSQENSLVMEISGITCKDEAEYRCFRTYLVDSLSTKFEEKSTNLTVEASPGDITIDANNQQISDQDKIYRYKVGELVRMTCDIMATETVDGDETELRWTYSASQFDQTQFRALPQDVKFVNTQTPNSNQGDGCDRLKFMSTATFNASIGTYNDRTIKCAFGRKRGAQFIEIKSTTAKLSVGDGVPTEAPSPSTGGDTDIGVIVGPIVGVLAFLVIVALIVYFCWYRKRKEPKENTYADEENKGGNMHVPPPNPIFYNPHKEKEKDKSTGITNKGMDNSFDSKDSANRGPPHYKEENGPDVNGPPYYNGRETETHRGWNNPGYDDEVKDGKRDREDRDKDRKRNRRDKEDKRSRREKGDNNYPGYEDPDTQNYRNSEDQYAQPRKNYDTRNYEDDEYQYPGMEDSPVRYPNADDGNVYRLHGNEAIGTAI